MHPSTETVLGAGMADTDFEKSGGWTGKSKAKIRDNDESKWVSESMGARSTAVEVLSPGTRPGFRFKVRMSVCLDLRHWVPKSPKLPGMGVSFVVSIFCFVFERPGCQHGPAPLYLDTLRFNSEDHKHLKWIGVVQNTQWD